MGLRTWLALKKPRRQTKRFRIFRADPMVRTPRGELDAVGVAYVSDPERAHVILARQPEMLRPYGHLNKRFAIWTHEPRWSLEQDRRAIVPGVANVVDVMNAYTGLVYQDNYHSNYAHRKAVDLDDRMRAFAEKPDRIATLATCRLSSKEYGGPLMIDGKDIDLTHTRDMLALHLYEQGRCDIYGRGWPKGVDLSGESRDNWVATKLKILAGYSVNLAFENTYISGYVTEKIWDAVAGATLPVYHGADNGVYRDFPRGSFIEAAGKSIETIADEILTMPRSERRDRYEACLRSYIPVASEDRYAASRAALAKRTADFLEEVMSRRPERAATPATGSGPIDKESSCDLRH